jgi:hypothetical protein
VLILVYFEAYLEYQQRMCVDGLNVEVIKLCQDLSGSNQSMWKIQVRLLDRTKSYNNGDLVALNYDTKSRGSKKFFLLTD